MGKPRDRTPREEIAGPSRKTRKPTEPMTLGNLRSLGPRSLDATCTSCGHRQIVTVDSWPDETPVPSFGPRMRCSKCGHLGANVRPDWTQLQAAPKR